MNQASTASHSEFRQITAHQAQQLLRDPYLIEESLRTGMDLGMLVENMLLAPAERWRKAYRDACAIAEWDDAARKAFLRS